MVGGVQCVVGGCCVVVAVAAITIVVCGVVAITVPFTIRPGLARFGFLAKTGGYFHSRALKLGRMVPGYALKSPRGVGWLDCGITRLSI